MKRLSPLLLAILFLAGCRAPMPSFNLLAPYGSTRIPPPATGSASADTYYQPGRGSSTPPVGTGFRARQTSSTDLSADASPDTTRRSTAISSDQSGRTRLASHEATTVVPTTLVPASTVVELRGPIEIVESGGSRTLSRNVRGMHINEARPEPARFYPTKHVIDITQLPPVSAGPNTYVVPLNQSVGSSFASSRNSSRSTSAGAGNWQPRN